jgi:hypothetical protein
MKPPGQLIYWFSRQLTSWRRLQDQSPTMRRSKAHVKALFSLRFFVGTAVDVATDVLLLMQLLPASTFGWLLLGAMFMADVLASLAMYLHLLAAIRSRRTGGAAAAIAGTTGSGMSFATSNTSSSGLGFTGSFNTGDSTAPWPSGALPMSSGKALLAAAARQATLVLLSLFLMPAISTSVHMLSLVMAVWLALVTFLWPVLPKHSWTLMGCLSIPKCCQLRSCIVSVIEAPPAIAFTTWAYLLPFKATSKVYINGNGFLISLLASMAHILMTLWEVRGHLVKGGSWGAVWRALTDLSPEGPPLSSPNHGSRTEAARLERASGRRAPEEADAAYGNDGARGAHGISLVHGADAAGQHTGDAKLPGIHEPYQPPADAQSPLLHSLVAPAEASAAPPDDWAVRAAQAVCSAASSVALPATGVDVATWPASAAQAGAQPAAGPSSPGSQASTVTSSHGPGPGSGSVALGPGAADMATSWSLNSRHMSGEAVATSGATSAQPRQRAQQGSHPLAGGTLWYPAQP